MIVSPAKAVAGTKKVEKALVRVENRANSLRRTLGLTFGALAGGAAIFSAIRSVAKFEESMALAGAVSKATEAQFAQLQKTALQLGLTTRFSANQAAEALVLLSRAGFSVDESLSSVEATLNLATAGGLGLAEAADITASALRGFNLSANETQRVTDVLVETTNSANTTVSQLGQALRFVAPIARGLNQSIEKTSAALGVLSDAGLKATLAGTGLRRVFAELESPGTELRRILEDAGIAADQIAPSTNELVDILKLLKGAGIDAGDALESFGQRGGPAFQVLVSNIPKLEELNAKIRESKGAAEDVAKALDKTLNGALIRVGSALNGLVQAFGQAGSSDVLVITLDGIAASLRVLADNIGLVTGAMIALAGVGVVKLVAAFGGPLLAVLSKVNVVAAAVVAGFTIAGRVFQAYEDDVRGAAEATANLEEDSKFIPKLGEQIAEAQRELNQLFRVEAGTGLIDDKEAVRAAVLAQKIKNLKVEIQDQAAAQKELNEREARGADTVDALIARLERRNALEAALTRESKTRVRVEQEIQKLLGQDALPTDDERKRIENAIKLSGALADQTRIFNDIRGPQEQFKRDLAALNALFELGEINVAEFNNELQELNDAQAGEAFDPDDLDSLQKLEDEISLLQQRLELGDERSAQIERENDILRDKGTLTDDEIIRMEKSIPLLAELTQKIKDRTEAERQGERDAKREERAIQRIVDQIDGQDRLTESIRLTNEAYLAGEITAEQLKTKLFDLEIAGLEGSIALEDGFKRAFMKISQEADNLAIVGEKVVNVFADKATDALVEFATTGKFVFKEFATAILNDLIKIIARLLVVQLIQSATGLGGAAPLLPAGGGGGREHGGTVQPDTSFTVGENGPEEFIPNRTGTIVPNAASQEQAPAPNIQIINVKSEDEIPEAIASGDATDALVNDMTNNRDRFRSALGIS